MLSTVDGQNPALPIIRNIPWSCRILSINSMMELQGFIEHINFRLVLGAQLCVCRLYHEFRVWLLRGSGLDFRVQRFWGYRA